MYIYTHKQLSFLLHTQTIPPSHQCVPLTNHAELSRIGLTALNGAERAALSLTGHVHHAAVAVVHQVARLAVDAAGRDAVALEEV